MKTKGREPKTGDPAPGHDQFAQRHRLLLALLISLLLVSGLTAVSTHDSSPLSNEASVKEGSHLVAPPSPAAEVASAPASDPPALVPAPAPPKAPLPKAAPRASKKPPPRKAAARRSPATGPTVYRGLGTWVDVYDWSFRYTGGRPTSSPEDVDLMADAGVQTLYIQASKHDSPTDVLEHDRLADYIERARGRGLAVVAWYLPTLSDPGRDLARLTAIARLPVDSVAVDIEARDVSDVHERNRRLVQLSSELRRRLPGRTLGAIVLPPVVTEVINPAYWPNFPYRQVAASYDVWMIMGYWTNRSGTAYRDAYRYTLENMRRLREHLGGVPIHPIGGIGDKTTRPDVEAYKRALAEGGGIGGSIYDWSTTRPELWPALRPLRR